MFRRFWGLRTPSTNQSATHFICRVSSVSVSLTDAGFVLELIARDFSLFRNSRSLSASLEIFEAAAAEIGEMKVISRVLVRQNCASVVGKSVVIRSNEISVQVPQSMIRLQSFVQRLMDRSVLAEYATNSLDVSEESNKKSHLEVCLSVRSLGIESDILESLSGSYRASDICVGYWKSFKGHVIAHSIRFVDHTGTVNEISLPGVYYSGALADYDLTAEVTLGLIEAKLDFEIMEKALVFQALVGTEVNDLADALSFSMDSSSVSLRPSSSKAMVYHISISSPGVRVVAGGNACSFTFDSDNFKALISNNRNKDKLRVHVDGLSVIQESSRGKELAKISLQVEVTKPPRSPPEDPGNMDVSISGISVLLRPESLKAFTELFNEYKSRVLGRSSFKDEYESLRANAVRLLNTSGIGLSSKTELESLPRVSVSDFIAAIPLTGSGKIDY